MARIALVAFAGVIAVGLGTTAPMAQGVSGGLVGKSAREMRSFFRPSAAGGNPSRSEVERRDAKSLPGPDLLPGLIVPTLVATTPMGIAEVGRFANTYFDEGASEIPPEFRSTLDELGAMLEEAESNEEFELHGYTNTNGPDEYNMQLSRARVEAMLDYLHERHEIRAQLRVVAHGEDPRFLARRPDGSEDKARSRRVMILQPARQQAAP